MPVSNDHISIEKVEVRNPACPPGTNDGEIAVHVTLKDEKTTAEYSVDGGKTYGKENVFSKLSPGEYNLMVRVAAIKDSELQNKEAIRLPEPDCPEKGPEVVIIDKVEVKQPECPPGTNNGEIIIHTTAKGTVEYSINGGKDYQSEKTFIRLEPGRYDIVVRVKEIAGSEVEYEEQVELAAPECPDPCDKYDDTCGTVLFPGDLMFIGFDNDTGFGTDRIVITTLVNIKPNTAFTITNARYEEGAGAEERTDKWYAADGEGNAIASHRILYFGTKIIYKGSTICFNLPDVNSYGVTLANNFEINGAASKDFCVSNNGNIKYPYINLKVKKASPLFLMQGDWTFHDDHGTFCGRVLSGMQYGAKWYRLQDEVPAPSNASRLHPHISCFPITAYFTSGSYATAWQPSLPQYDWLQLLDAISDFSQWNHYEANGKNNLPETTCATSVRVVKGLT